MPDTPEQRARVLCGELQFFTPAMFRNLEPQVISTIASAIREAVEREREECAKVAGSMIGASRREIAAAIRARGDKQGG